MIVPDVWGGIFSSSPIDLKGNSLFTLWLNSFFSNTRGVTKMDGKSFPRLLRHSIDFYDAITNQ